MRVKCSRCGREVFVEGWAEPSLDLIRLADIPVAAVLFSHPIKADLGTWEGAGTEEETETFMGLGIVCGQSVKDFVDARNEGFLSKPYCGVVEYPLPETAP